MCAVIAIAGAVVQEALHSRQDWSLVYGTSLRIVLCQWVFLLIFNSFCIHIRAGFAAKSETVVAVISAVTHLGKVTKIGGAASN